MGQEKQWRKNEVNGSIDVDTDPSSTAEENTYSSRNYLYNLNMRDGGSDDRKGSGKKNIKGTILINDQVLPAGTNKCVGAYEDPFTPSILFWNWNSNGDHGIYQYFPYQTGGVFGRVIQLCETDLLNHKREWLITGANLLEKKLLYWVNGYDGEEGIQGNPPRKINIIKANDYQRKREYLFFSDRSDWTDPAFDNALVFVTVYNDAGAVSEADILSIPLPQASYEVAMQTLTDSINDNVTVLSAEFCKNCGIEITVANLGKTKLEIGVLLGVGGLYVAGNSMLIATNHYPDLWIKEYFDRIKFPLPCHPTIKFNADSTRKQNLIAGKFFQFATRMRYDDGEKSVLSPYSEFTFSPLPCGSDLYLDPFNYITVDFTDERLQNAGICATLVGVDLMMRESIEGIPSKWKLVKTFDRCELEITSQKFDFYNDGIYTVLDDTTLVVQHDVPLISCAQEFIQNIGFLGANKIGYPNLECPEGKLAVEYDPEDTCENEEMATIKGKILIHNPHTVDAAGDATHQPIYNAGTGVVFGGMSSGFTDNAGINYKQWLYMRGWRVYSADTEFSALSIQHLDPTFGITLEGGIGNVYSADTPAQRDAIRAAMNAGKVYSEFELKLPAGTHVLRAGTHLLQELADGSPHDFNGPYSSWQKTSTYVYSMGGTGLPEIIVTVAPGEVLTIPDTIIMDLKDTSSFNSKAVSGYLIDAAGISLQDTLFISPRMEKTQMQAHITAVGSTNAAGYNNLGKTDHNGFFWWTSGGYVFTGADNVDFSFLSRDLIIVMNSTFLGTDNFYEGGLPELAAGTCVTIGAVSVGNEHKSVIIYATNADVHLSCCTTIEGKVVDPDLAPIAGAKVLYGGTNRFATTDSGGNFSILIYADATTNDRNDYLMYRYDSACCVEFPSGDKVLVHVTPFTTGGTYSFGFPKVVADWIINILGKGVVRQLKHRNKAIAGIVYTDGARCSKANHWKDFEAYIPFMTEPGGNFGVPKLKYQIDHAGPDWATHYYIVLLKNPVYNRWLQTILGTVKYIKHTNTDEEGVTELIETTFPAGDANEIHLSLKPLVDYAAEHSDSLLGWIPEINDRITFIKDPAGVPFAGYFDYRIMSKVGEGTPSDPLTIVIRFNSELPEILSGTLIELWTPKLVATTEIFYEIMECHEMFMTVFGNTHLAGTNGDNQSLNPDTLQPATGYIQYGDCYVRKRKMLVKDDTVDPETITYYTRSIEDQRVNDYDINSLILSIGRGHIQDKDWKQIFHRTRISHSGVFISNENTVVNDYNRFLPLDYTDLERSYGTINRLVRIGESAEMLAIHAFQLQPIYVGYKEIYDLSGDKTIGKSTDVINIAQPLVESGGTTNPESIIVWNNWVAGYSVYWGIFWRYSNNGVQRISDYKLITWTTNRSRQLRKISKDLIRVYGCADPDNHEFVWAFEDINFDPENPFINIGGTNIGEGMEAEEVPPPEV